MAYLILVRHGQSEWNAKGLWTGLTDVALNVEGKLESQKAALKLSDIPIAVAFTSKLIRAKQTLEEIMRELGYTDLPVFEDEALNERDYGKFTGKNKWKIKKEYGNDVFLKIRRSWDYPIPGGETLKDVYNRVVPYYERQILPFVRAGKNVIVVAHGNSLRALCKYLEKISNKDISKLEMATGELYVYKLNKNGSVLAKEVRSINSKVF